MIERSIRTLIDIGIDLIVIGTGYHKEKFEAFAKSLPLAFANPMYHWTHLELQRYFDISTPLNERSCKEIWEKCNEKLASDNFRVRDIIRKSNVKLICTTDDPGDSLEWHKKIAADSSAPCKVLPAWRPDKAMKIEKPEFASYVEHISKLTGKKIDSCKAFFEAIDERMKFFNDMGCRAADHGIDYAYCKVVSDSELERIYEKGLANETLTSEEIEAYKSMILLHLAEGLSDG